MLFEERPMALALMLPVYFNKMDCGIFMCLKLILFYRRTRSNQQQFDLKENDKKINILNG